MPEQRQDNAEHAPRIFEPCIVEAAGNKPKQLREYIGQVASGDTTVSIASMRSPSGWLEPAQTPEFDEFTVVLRGELHVTSLGGTQIVRAGQALRVLKGTTVQYATPGSDGAEYIAVCLPAFAPDRVHRSAT